jgi:nitrate reductase delta subunit
VTVTDLDRRRLALGAFAELLSYPTADPAPAARRCRALLSARSAAALAPFVSRAEQARAHELEEAYSSTFDLDPACVPYVGHQLVGESPVRGPFLAELMGVYARCGYRPRQELGDHVAEVLGYLAVAPAGPDRDDLVRDGLLPALEKMVEALRDRENPYLGLLVAVQSTLTPPSRAAAPRARAEVR